MKKRAFWQHRIEELWNDRNLIWLSGVRRAGKTVLSQSIAGAEYFDCELPSVRQRLSDPEMFWRSLNGKTIVLDEVHRLIDPSEVLKIAADHFPEIRVLATGSSTLSARKKFKDTLTGRKNELWLTGMVSADLDAFGVENIDDRMLKGGLPPFLMSRTIRDSAFREWVDSFWAKDLQELFVIDKKAAFMKFMELLFVQSGDLFEAQPLATACEISRQTIQNYLAILETTLAAVVLRPYSSRAAAEIKSQPRVFAFDTGFVCYFKGITSLRDDDRGPLLEHLVLNELLAAYPREALYYWRDKQRHEVDFVLKPGRAEAVVAIECKCRSSKFDPAGISSFRGRHPEGRNLVACLDVNDAWTKRFGDHEVTFVHFKNLLKILRDA